MLTLSKTTTVGRVSCQENIYKFLDHKCAHDVLERSRQMPLVIAAEKPSSVKVRAFGGGFEQVLFSKLPYIRHVSFLIDMRFDAEKRANHLHRLRPPTCLVVRLLRYSGADPGCE